MGSAWARAWGKAAGTGWGWDRGVRDRVGEGTGFGGWGCAVQKGQVGSEGGGGRGHASAQGRVAPVAVAFIRAGCSAMLHGR